EGVRRQVEHTAVEYVDGQVGGRDVSIQIHGVTVKNVHDVAVARHGAPGEAHPRWIGCPRTGVVPEATASAIYVRVICDRKRRNCERDKAAYETCCADGGAHS